MTLSVIVLCFTPEIQGYHYTFASLLALQSFAELGLSLVIINVASHEWSELSLDSKGRLAGAAHSLSRLVSLGRLVFGWYAFASLLFVIVVSAVGFVFFSEPKPSTVSWQAPWLSLVLVTGLQLWLLSLTSLLEGCNQVATVQQFRLAQTVTSSLAFWTVAAVGGGLWAAVAMAVVRLTVDLCLVVVRYGEFFRSFLVKPVGPVMSWRDDVWPMQWRLGVSGVVNYVANGLYNPVMFRYHGAAVAGQMGLSIQVVGAVQSLAMVFVSTKVPTFGVLIARRDYTQLDGLWKRSALVSLLVMAGGGAALAATVSGLTVFEPAAANRFLPLTHIILMVTAAVLMQISQCQTAYMRAHRAEPIVVLSVTMSLVSGLSVWLLGSSLGPLGAVGGSVAIAVVVVLWETAIWRRFRDQAIAGARTS